MFKNSTRSLPGTLMLLLLFPVFALAQGYNVFLRAEKADPVYKIGETVKFLADPSKDGKPTDVGTVEYTLTKDVGGPVLGSGTLKANGKPLAITGKLDEPGFLYCSIAYKVEPKSAGIPYSAGAAVEPTKIKPSLPVPGDFDLFWNGWKKKVSKLPMNVKLKPMPLDPKNPLYKNVEAFEITINCLGPRPVRGYFARPKNAKPKSCPAYANYYYFNGFSPCSLDRVADLAANGYIAFDVNAHGIDPGGDKQYYDRLRGEIGGFTHQGLEDRNNYYFLWMYLRNWQALQYLISLPSWDGKVLIVNGSSMGGGQAIAAGGLEPRVSLVLANVPAMCDHSGFKANRVCGWFRFVPGVPPASQNKVLQTLRYFDGMNFATRIQGEAVLSCGFIDGSCAPTSVYAAFNNIKGPKQIVYEPTMGHASSPKIQDAFNTAITRQVQAAHPPASLPSKK
jgi:cephalosporin-C deacetylase